MTNQSSSSASETGDVPERRRGKIILDAGACTSCMVCVRECPVWCIELDANKVHDPDAGPRGKSRLELTTFKIDYGLCMDCGICIDVCPTDALSWDQHTFPGQPNRAGFTPELS
ncbi:MAG: 4Fe-4S binding protein [Candidatus Nanopelagicales bacterium]